jgi:hypothetical protein
MAGEMKADSQIEFRGNSSQENESSVNHQNEHTHQSHSEDSQEEDSFFKYPSTIAEETSTMLKSVHEDSTKTETIGESPSGSISSKSHTISTDAGTSNSALSAHAVAEEVESSKPEALRWWQNKYGMKMPRAMNERIKNAIKNSSFSDENDGRTEDDSRNIEESARKIEASRKTTEELLGHKQGSALERKEEREEVEMTAPFSSQDEEDDIFGGLDLEEDSVSKLEDSVFKLVAQGEEGGQVVQAAKKDFSMKSHNSSEAVEKAHATLRKYQETPKDQTDPADTIFSFDRSGTTVDDSEKDEVSSEITSSVFAGGPSSSWATRPEMNTPRKSDRNTPVTIIEERSVESSSNASKAPLTPASHVSKATKVSKNTTKKSSNNPHNAPKMKLVEHQKEEVEVAQEYEDEESALPTGSMFMNFGLGIVKSITTSVATGVCQFTETDGSDVPVEKSESYSMSVANSAATGSQLTDLEKRVWSEWEKRDEKVKQFNRGLPSIADTTTPEPSQQKAEHEKKREAARGKLLDFASSAISFQFKPKVQQNPADGKEGEYTDDSASTGEESQSSIGVVDSKETMSHHSSNETTSFSEMESHATSCMTSKSVDYVSAMSKCCLGSTTVIDPILDRDQETSTTMPILLSFSQRSLIEKFTKNLANDGVEVLKLNTRNQWQLRYFTVSKEKIALTAHEANSQSGDVAQCPKALLWLKKFNPNAGGYALGKNIDKSGHGGMMLLELTDATVVNNENTTHPIPKNLSSKFKDSVLVTVAYTINGGPRSVSFRCKNNDEAQFLCTCMRVIRDLLKREQFLRLRTPQSAEAKRIHPQNKM